MAFPVVSYSISTSNHNWHDGLLPHPRVVSYSISTSNHNQGDDGRIKVWLCLILFLHQTTTCRKQLRRHISCVLFYFYIKPQPIIATCLIVLVVSYSISTSNHNIKKQLLDYEKLCLILFLHQTTTVFPVCFFSTKLCLILFLHQTTTLYIKH